MTPPPGQQPQEEAAAPPQPMPMAPPAPQPSWAEVLPLLKQDRLRGFRIDVETDSTLAPDPAAEQEAAVNFVGMLAQYLSAAIPAAAAGQIPPDVVGQILLFVTRRFPVARDLEATLEGWVEKLSNGQAQIAMPPDPAMGLEQERIGLDREKMAQEGQQFDKTQAFQAQQAEAERAAQAEAEQKKLNGPPFVMGEDGAPQGAQALVAAMQQEFEQEMTGIGQAIAQMMQMQAQHNQMQLQIMQQILAALGQPKMKQVQVQSGPDGRIAGARVMEAPVQGGGV
jgi:Skp family chaperone for outer membrane proteins